MGSVGASLLNVQATFSLPGSQHMRSQYTPNSCDRRKNSLSLKWCDIALTSHAQPPYISSILGFPVYPQRFTLTADEYSYDLIAKPQRIKSKTYPWPKPRRQCDALVIGNSKYQRRVPAVIGLATRTQMRARRNSFDLTRARNARQRCARCVGFTIMLWHGMRGDGTLVPAPSSLNGTPDLYSGQPHSAYSVVVQD